MNTWHAFVTTYPEGDLVDGGNVSGFGLTYTMLHFLKQYGTDVLRGTY